MSPLVVVLIILAVVLPIDAVVVWAIMRHAAAEFFGPLADRHPACEPEPDAEQRRFLSFQLHGMLNFGLCMHAAVDDAFVHVRPAWLPRICGARASSVPIQDVGFESDRPRDRRAGKGVIAGIKVRASPWIFEKAAQRLERTSNGTGSSDT